MLRGASLGLARWRFLRLTCRRRLRRTWGRGSASTPRSVRIVVAVVRCSASSRSRAARSRRACSLRARPRVAGARADRTEDDASHRRRSRGRDHGPPPRELPLRWATGTPVRTPPPLGPPMPPPPCCCPPYRHLSVPPFRRHPTDRRVDLRVDHRRAERHRLRPLGVRRRAALHQSRRCASVVVGRRSP